MTQVIASAAAAYGQTKKRNPEGGSHCCAISAFTGVGLPLSTQANETHQDSLNKKGGEEKNTRSKRSGERKSNLEYNLGLWKKERRRPPDPPLRSLTQFVEEVSAHASS